MKPIIDVHAHVFCARDIPLEGYLRSRAPVTVIEKLVNLRGLRFILIAAMAKYIREENIRWRERDSNIDRSIGRIALEIISATMGRQYKQWAKTLSKEVIDIAKEMVDDFIEDHIDLYVPLMIDYEYWFESTIDNPIKDQIEHIYEKIVLPYKGRVHPFVAFDPARELAYQKHMLNPDGKPDLHGSMALVEDAIKNKGFIGVKLYNSLGYRPFNNATVDDKRRNKIKLHQKMGYHIFKGEDYDGALSELYQYCIDEEVPITAHCVMDGIEAYRDASFDFGQAVFWHEVLSQETYKDLRLNLAHFGWNSNKKHGYGKKRSWVKDICEMLLDYDYLFTDVSHHRVTLDNDRERFKSDYGKIRSDFPDEDFRTIKKKLLFGIDWHVIKRVKDYQRFKKRYIEVLEHEGLFTKEEIADFLGGNALDFLGLLPGGKNRARLEGFYKDHGIDPPEWFKSTSSLNDASEETRS